MAVSDKGKFVDDNNHKGKSMMPLDDDMYCKKVTLLNDEIMEESRKILQKKIANLRKGLGGGGCLREYVGVVVETEDGDSDIELLMPTPWSDESKNEKRQKEKDTEVMKDKVIQEHVYEEEVSLNNNIGKLSHDLVEMPSKAVEQGIDDHVPD
ncbi:hypothetical protein Tco_1525093 [Tanacetum coccineum]